VEGVLEERDVDRPSGREPLRLGAPEEDEVGRRRRARPRGEERGGDGERGQRVGGERPRIGGLVGRRLRALLPEEQTQPPGQQHGGRRDERLVPVQVEQDRAGHRQRQQHGAGRAGEDDPARHGEPAKRGMREQREAAQRQKAERREPQRPGHGEASPAAWRRHTLPSRVSKRSLPGGSAGRGPTTITYSARPQTSGGVGCP
jgi:hypothetical protein